MTDAEKAAVFVDFAAKLIGECLNDRIAQRAGAFFSALAGQFLRWSWRGHAVI
jgi:hypothetical protein